MSYWEFLLVAVILLGIAALTVGVPVGHLIRNSAVLRAVYRQFAQRVNGYYQATGIFGPPSVAFYHRGKPVVVSASNKGGKFTEVELEWPDTRLRCEIYPETTLTGLRKLFGLEEVEIGVPHFDDAFIIQCPSPQRASAILTAQVQAIIFELQRCSLKNDIYVRWSAGTLVIKTKGQIDELERLRVFVVLALRLFDQTIIVPAELVEPEGITFLDTSTGPEPSAEKPSKPVAKEEVICQICGDSVTADPVLCRSCKTPHHQDCWEYNGACSTYGCGQKKFVVPTKRQSGRSPQSSAQR